jgi:hypothetical protein
MDKVLLCDCGQAEHQLIFSADEDESEEVYISIKLNNHSFWRRLKWLFGFRSRFGEYDELITTKTKLKELLDEL